jgi:hypothetical protein
MEIFKIFYLKETVSMVGIINVTKSEHTDESDYSKLCVCARARVCVSPTGSKGL